MPLLLFLFFSAVSAAASEEWENRGEVGLSFKGFRSEGGETADQNRDVSLRWTGFYDQGNATAKASFFFRKDMEDSGRNLINIEEAHYALFLDEAEELKVLFGYNLYKWSIMEAFNLANSINSADYTSTSKTLMYRGEAVFEMERAFDFGTISYYFFPRFIPPVLPGKAIEDRL